jgi:uncharacterized repeat protein (TIGR03803 family)
MKKSFLLRGTIGIVFWISIVFIAVISSARGWQVSTLHSFGFPNGSANRPSSGVILGSDGWLYGTAAAGGAHSAGVVFRCDKDGSHFQIIHDFDPGIDRSGAAYPLAGVLEASDGKLYGTTFVGGTNFGGTIFCVNKDGSGFQEIHDFERAPDENYVDPYAELIEGTDGLLYGTTRSGGTLDNGTIFQIAKDGSAYRVLHEFDFNSGAGAFPEAPLLQGSDGLLYGTTSDHRYDVDPPGAGKVFKINPDGSGYAVIHDFDSKTNDGNYPAFGLIEGSDGAFYGTTVSGGKGDGGVAFRLRKNGTGYSVLYNFSRSLPNPSLPFGPLREGPSGLLYGVTELGGAKRGGTIFSLDKNRHSLSVVDTFARSSHDVKLPVGALALDAAGNLYGGSMEGGLSGGGTIFRCLPGGGHQILHNFNASGGDGGNPNSPLSLGTNGVLYGTTPVGGWFGNGTIYQMNGDGSGYKVLQNLSETPAGVIADPTNSDLYLTTFATPTHRRGNLYRVALNGRLKLLHGFHSAKNFEAAPSIPLAASDGILYGSVSGGKKFANGFIYRIQKNGQAFQILYAFTNQSGEFPPLIEGSDGMLYGMEPDFSPPGPGTAFKIAKDGTGFTVLHTFRVNFKFGWYSQPTGPLVEGGDGFIYGVGAEDSSPFVFRMDKYGGNFQSVQTFSSGVSGLTEGNDGGIYGIAHIGPLFRIDTSLGNLGIISYGTPLFLQPVSGLTQLPNGVFYGTTTEGGDMNLGYLFKLTPP